jgi:hypothetical protein
MNRSQVPNLIRFWYKSLVPIKHEAKSTTFIRGIMFPQDVPVYKYQWPHFGGCLIELKRASIVMVEDVQ